MLLHLWDEAGESAGTIARMLGGTSRSAVMGKLHRLGKLGDANGPARAKAPSRVRRPSAYRKPAARRLPLLRRPNRLPQRVAPMRTQKELQPLISNLLDLREGHCRWPYGHPGKRGFGFCGHPAPGPYCDHHRGIAYR